MTSNPDLRIANARRSFTYKAASLKLAIAQIDHNQPFDLAIFEQQINHVIEAARELAQIEEQARKATAA